MLFYLFPTHFGVCFGKFHTLYQDVSWKIDLSKMLVFILIRCNTVYAQNYRTRHVKMDSTSRVSLKANLARNTSHGASRMPFDNKPRVEYMPLEPRTINRAQNVVQISRGRSLTVKCVSRGFWGTHARDSRIFVQFHVSCTVLLNLEVSMSL